MFRYPLSASFLYAAQSSQLSSCQYSSSSMNSHSSQSQSSSYSSQPSQWYFLFHQRDRSCHQHKGLKAVVILVIPLSQRDLIHALVAAAVKLFCQPHLTLLVFLRLHSKLKSRKSPPRDQTTASPKRLVKSRNIRICAVSLIMIIIPLLPHHLKSVKNHCQIVQIFEIVFGQIVTCQAMALTVFPIILPPWVSDRLPFWGIRNFCTKKAVHWYCTNKPPLRNWRAYFDNPLLF